MKQTCPLMGMPITVEILDKQVNQQAIQDVYDYFTYVDQTFSTYKETSEISRINQGKLKIENASEDVRSVLLLCEETKKESNGLFDIQHRGKIDPSGLVKGWAIQRAAELLKRKGFTQF